MELISNNKLNNHLKVLKTLLSEYEEVFIAVAFFKKSGLDLLRNDIKLFLEQGNEMILVCGLDFYQTDPDALKEMLCYTQKFENCKMYIRELENSKTFHPKIYYFRKGKEATLITGSSNFTKGGFVDNFETSTLNIFKRDSIESFNIEQLINTLKNQAVVYSEVEISNYARKYQIHKRNLVIANKTSKAETNKLFNLNTERLQGYLEKYYLNSKEQKDLKQRNENYINAEKVLERIRLEELSKPEFFELYEKLVGKAGEHSLWHSGSIYRGKSTVKEYYIEFKEMLNDIFKNLNESPYKLFKTVQKYFQIGNPKKIKSIGPNIITEILNTYAPSKFAVLNQNPLASLKYLGFEEFPNPQSFKPEKYNDFVILISSIMKGFNFESLGEEDHFLNYIYWEEKNKKN